MGLMAAESLLVFEFSNLVAAWSSCHHGADLFLSVQHHTKLQDTVLNLLNKKYKNNFGYSTQ